MDAHMKHRAFDILSQLAQPQFGAPDLIRLNAFKTEVRKLQVAVAGKRAPPPSEHAVTLECMELPGRASLPTLPVFLQEADALGRLGAGAYFMAPFELVIAAAQRRRMDVAFQDGEAIVLIAHATLLAMRDLAHVGADGLNLPAEQAMEHLDAIRKFASHARSYCARQSDIRTLHLATLSFPGVRPMLAGALSADRYNTHAQVLTQLSTRLFEPGWRFVLCERSAAPSTVIASVRGTPPCYDRACHQHWWERLKQRFNAPQVELIRLDLRQSR